MSNIKESVRFYTQTLGMELLRQVNLPGSDAALAFVADKNSGIEVDLTYNRDGRSYELGDDFGRLAFYVTSVDEAFEMLKQKGVTF